MDAQSAGLPRKRQLRENVTERVANATARPFSTPRLAATFEASKPSRERNADEQHHEKKPGCRRLLLAGTVLSVICVAVFIATRQPYAGIVCFALLVTKSLMLSKHVR